MSIEIAGGKNVNPNYGKGDERYGKNCQACMGVFEARLRGYDIEALPYDEKTHRFLEYHPEYMFINPETNEFVGGNIEQQTTQILKNIEGLLQAAGYTYNDVVKTTCFLADMSDFAVFNSIYEKAFVSKPARSCVAAKALPKGALAEIEVIAVK